MKTNTITFPQNVDPSVKRLFKYNYITPREYNLDISRGMGMCWVAGLLHQNLDHDIKLMELHKKHKLLTKEKAKNYRAYYADREFRNRQESEYWQFQIFYTNIYEVPPCCMCLKMQTCEDSCERFVNYTCMIRGIRHAKREEYKAKQRAWALKNKDAINARNRERKEQNRKRLAKNQRAYRARKKGKSLLVSITTREGGKENV
jgi:hypothetical protein